MRGLKGKCRCSRQHQQVVVTTVGLADCPGSLLLHCVNRWLVQPEMTSMMSFLATKSSQLDCPSVTPALSTQHTLSPQHEPVQQLAAWGSQENSG